jgi:glycosyltransferase involved in cell wall biosynthesis
MQGLHIVGPIYGATGYDRHTREFARHLGALGVPVQIFPMRGWSPELPLFQNDASLQALLQSVEADTVLHFAMPPHCRPVPGKRNINYTMFEADRIPAAWAPLATQHDRIVVPTAACADAWIAGGVPDSHVRISPLAVDGAFFATPAEPLAIGVNPVDSREARPLAGFRTRFLNIAELRPRKNLLGLLRSWIRATNTEDDAVLVLKCTSFNEADMRALEEDVRRLQHDLGRTLREAAPVTVLQGACTDEQLRALYHSVTHYISMSFGEGWDQPMMEAAASGLQLIAPDHTGYQAYLTAQDASLLPTERVPVAFEGAAGGADWIFFAGTHWWRPSEDAAIEAIRSALRGVSMPPPSQRIVRDFTWTSAAEKLLAVLREP